MQRPLRKADLVVREVEDELLLYDAGAGDTHLLNATGASILELCDGSYSPSAIAEMIQAVTSVEREIALADVAKFLTELSQRGLIQEAPAESPL